MPIINNPNIISEIHNPFDRLNDLFGVYNRNHSSNSEKAILENAQTIKETYDRAVEIIKELGQPKATSRLTAKLVPRFSDQPAELRDEKIGGIPDLRSYLYTKRNENGKYNLSEIYPRCGVCHESMKFVGQFNLLPWLMPIHAAFGIKRKDWKYDDDYSLKSMFGIGTLGKHSSIFSDYMFHTFACPLSGMHHGDPNYDAQILISYEYSETDLKDQSTSPETISDYEASIPELKEDEYAFQLESRKIEGWDFRLALDEFSIKDWKKQDRFEKDLEQYPDIFSSYGRFSLLGEPNSQQEPRRYFNNRGNRMTPFISFNDENADFTYQIYADFEMSDGFSVFCKVDGSCT